MTGARSLSLAFAARNLVYNEDSGDNGGTINPVIIVNEHRNGRLLGQTEWIRNTANPNFVARVETQLQRNVQLRITLFQYTDSEMRSNAQIGYVVLNTQRIKIDESKSGISYNDAGKEGKYNDNDNGNEEREKSGDLNGSGSSVDKTLPKEQLFRLKLKHKTPNIQAQLSAKKAYVMIKITSQYRARQELIQQQEHLYPQQEFILQNSKQVQQHQRNRTFLPPQTLASNTSLTTQPQFITPVAPLLYASHRTYDGRATDTFPDSNDKRHDYVNNNNNNNNVRNATSTTTTNNDNDNDDNRDNNDNNNSINNSSIYNSSIDIDKNCCNVSRKGSSHIVVPAYTSHTYSQQETKPRHVHARAYFYPSHPQQLHQSDSPKPTHSLHLGHSNCSDISSQRKNSSSGDHSWNVDPSCPSCYSLHYRLMQSQAHVQRLEAILDTTLQSNSKYEKTDEKESSNINEIDLGGTETNGVEEKRKVNDDNDSDNEDGKRANVIVLSEVHRMKGLIDLKDHQLIKQQQIIQDWSTRSQMLESRCSELRQKIHIFQIQQQQYLAATATVRQGDVRNSTLIELNSDSDCDSNTESDSDSESESKSESESESESDNGSDSSSVSGSDTYDKSTTEENSNSGSGGESDGSDLGDYERINPGHDTSRRRSLDHGITTGAGEASASLDKAHSCSTTDNNNDIAETKTRDINSIHTSTTPAINNSGLLDIIHASRHSNDSSNDVHITSLIRHPQSADKNIIPERKTIRSRIRQQQHQIHALKEQIKQLKTKSQTWKERVRQDNILIIQGKLALEKLTKEVELLKYQRDTLAFTSGDDGRKLRSVKEQTLLDEEHKKERTLLRKKNHNLTHATLSALTSLNHALNHYLSLSHNMHLINKMHANQIGFTLSFSCAGILNVKEMRNKQSPEKPNTFISLSIGHHHDFQFYRDQSTKTKKNNTTRKKTKNPHNDDGSSCEIFRPSPLSSYRQNTFIINGLIKGEGEDIHNDNYLNIDKETFDSSSCGLPSELNHTIAHSYQLVGHTEVKNNSVNPKFSSRLQVMPPPGGWKGHEAILLCVHDRDAMLEVSSSTNDMHKHGATGVDGISGKYKNRRGSIDFYQSHKERPLRAGHGNDNGNHDAGSKTTSNNNIDISQRMGQASPFHHRRLEFHFVNPNSNKHSTLSNAHSSTAQVEETTAESACASIVGAVVIPIFKLVQGVDIHDIVDEQLSHYHKTDTDSLLNYSLSSPSSSRTQKSLHLSLPNANGRKIDSVRKERKMKISGPASMKCPLRHMDDEKYDQELLKRSAQVLLRYTAFDATFLPLSSTAKQQKNAIESDKGNAISVESTKSPPRNTTTTAPLPFPSISASLSSSLPATVSHTILASSQILHDAFVSLFANLHSFSDVQDSLQQYRKKNTKWKLAASHALKLQMQSIENLRGRVALANNKVEELQSINHSEKQQTHRNGKAGDGNVAHTIAEESKTIISANSVLSNENTDTHFKITLSDPRPSDQNLSRSVHMNGRIDKNLIRAIEQQERVKRDKLLKECEEQKREYELQLSVLSSELLAMEVEFKSQSEIVETLILENTEKDDNMAKMEELVRKMDESRKKTINRAHSMKKKYQHLREIHDTLQNVVANQKIALNEFKSMTSDDRSSDTLAIHSLEKKNKYLHEQLQEKKIALEMVETQVTILEGNYKTEVKRCKKLKSSILAQQLEESRRNEQNALLRREREDKNTSIRRLVRENTNMREQLKVLEQKSSVSKAHTLLEVVKAYKSTLECMTADGISRLVQMQLAFCSMEDKLAKMNAQTFLKKSNTSGSISKLRDIVPMSTINGIDEECKRFHDKGDATTLVPACVNIPFTEMHASALATGGVSGGQVVNSNQEAITDLVEDNFSERQTGDNEEKIVSVYSIKLAIAAKNLDLLDYNAPLNTYASYIVSHAESTSLSSLITSCIPAYNKGGLHRTDDKSTSYGNGNKFMESNSNDMTELDKNNGNPTYKRALTVPHLKLSKAKPHPVVNHTKKEKYDPFIYILIHQVDSAHLPSTASVRAMTGKGKYHMRMYSDDILSLSSNPPPSGCPIQSLVGVVREPIRLSKLLEMSVRRKSVTMKLINPLNRSLEKRLHARSACVSIRPFGRRVDKRYKGSVLVQHLKYQHQQQARLNQLREDREKERKMKRRITGSHAERNACVIVSVPHLDGASVNEHTEDQKRKRGRLSGEMDDCSEGNDESSCQTDFDTVDAIESLLRTDSLVQLLDHVYCVEQLLHFLQGRTGEAGEEWNKIQSVIAKKEHELNQSKKRSTDVSALKTKFANHHRESEIKLNALQFTIKTQNAQISNLELQMKEHQGELFRRKSVIDQKTIEINELQSSINQIHQVYDDLQSENKLSDQDGNKNVVSKNSGSADGKETSDGNEDGHTNTQANHEWGKGRIDRSLLNDLISQINDHGNDEGEVNGSDHTYNNGHKGERRDETAVDEDSVDNDDDKSDLDDGYELLHTHIQPSPIKVSVRGIMNSMEDVDKKDNRDQSARIEEADIVINQTHSERYNDNTDDNDNDDSCDNNNQQQKNSDENSPRDETGRGTKRTSQKNVNKVGRLLVCSSSAGKISSRSKSTSNNSIKIINSTPARVRSTSKKKARNRSRSNSTKRSVASRPASASYISTASSYSKKSSLKAKSLSRTSKSKSKSLKQKATRVERRSLAKTPNRMSLTSKIRRLPVRMSATHSRNTRDADTTQVRSSKSAKNRLASTSIKKARAFKVRTLKHMTPHKSIQSADDCESTKRTLRMNSPGDHDSNSSDTTCGENTGTVCLTLPSHNPALHFESSLGNSTHGTEERTRSGGKDRKNRPKIKACAVSDREGGDGGRSPVPQLSSTYNSEGVVYLRMRCKAILPTFFQSLWHDVHSSSSSVLASPLLVGNSYVYKLSLSVYVTERETGEYTEAGKTEWSAHTDTSGGGNVDEFIVFRNPVPIVVSCDPRKTSSSSSMPLSSFARSIGYVTNEQDMKMVLYATKHKRKDKSKHIPFHSREGKELRQKVKKVKHRSQPGRFENDEGVNGEHGDHIHSSKRSATGSLSVSPVPVKKKVLGFAYMAVEELFLSKEGKGETVEKGESIPSTVQLVNSWNSNLNTMLAHAKSCIEITAGL